MTPTIAADTFLDILREATEFESNEEFYKATVDLECKGDLLMCMFRLEQIIGRLQCAATRAGQAVYYIVKDFQDKNKETDTNCEF